MLYREERTYTVQPKKGKSSHSERSFVAIFACLLHARRRAECCMSMRAAMRVQRMLRACARNAHLIHPSTPVLAVFQRHRRLSESYIRIVLLRSLSRLSVSPA